MSKQFLGVLAAIIIVFIGIFALTSNGNKSKSSSSSSSNSSLSQHVIGSGTSGVTVVEYGDFECPYCQQYSSTVKLVRAEFADKIKFQFRNFPLVNIHRNAFAASRAAEAASSQGKFWEMHDALYETNNWQTWTTATDPTPFFKQYAQQLGLNTTQFSADFASSKVNDTINADMAEGNKLGISGTPTFFINGKKTEIANNPQAFEKAINEAAKSSSSSTSKQN